MSPHTKLLLKPPILTNLCFRLSLRALKAARKQSRVRCLQTLCRMSEQARHIRSGNDSLEKTSSCTLTTLAPEPFEAEAMVEVQVKEVSGRAAAAEKSRVYRARLRQHLQDVAKATNTSKQSSVYIFKPGFGSCRNRSLGWPPSPNHAHGTASTGSMCRSIWEKKCGTIC